MLHFSNEIVTSNSSNEDNASLETNQLMLEYSNHTILSNYTSYNYSLTVELPEFYDENKTAGYPVVIFIDYLHSINPNIPPQIYLPFIRNNFLINWTELSETGQTSEFILVDIININHTLSSHQFEMVSSTENYVLFLKNEVIPLLNQTYNINMDELAITGSDLSGSFTLEHFFYLGETPFKYFLSIYPYILTSGLFQVDQRLIDLEREFYNQTSINGSSPKRVLYLAVDTTQDEVYEFLLDYSLFVLSRGYVNQSMILDFGWGTSIVPYKFRDGVIAIFTTTPSIDFLSSVEIEYYTGMISQPHHFVNDTITFTFFGYLGNRTQVSFEWYINNELVGTTNKLEYVFQKNGLTRVRLDVTDEFNITYSNIKTYSINLPPVPPFDFRTAQTTLNSETYLTKTKFENVDYPFTSMMLIAIPLVRLFQRNYRRKNSICA